MISIYKTIEDDMVVLDKIEEGCWISAIHPNEEELSFLQEETGIDLDDLRAPLDDEERSRIELEDGYNMILVDIPSLDEKDRYVKTKFGFYHALDLTGQRAFVVPAAGKEDVSAVQICFDLHKAQIFKACFQFGHGDLIFAADVDAPQKSDIPIHSLKLLIFCVSCHNFKLKNVCFF